MDYTETQLDLILDAYVERSDVQHVAEVTGLEPDDVRVLFENGAIANRAAARKMTSCAVWFLGIGMDAIQDALVDANVSLRDKLSAVRLTKDIMAQFRSHELTQPPPALPAPALPPAEDEQKPKEKIIETVVIRAPSLEAMVKALNDDE